MEKTTIEPTSNTVHAIVDCPVNGSVQVTWAFSKSPFLEVPYTYGNRPTSYLEEGTVGWVQHNLPPCEEGGHEHIDERCISIFKLHGSFTYGERGCKWPLTVGPGPVYFVIALTPITEDDVLQGWERTGLYFRLNYIAQESHSGVLADLNLKPKRVHFTPSSSIDM